MYDIVVVEEGPLDSRLLETVQRNTLTCNMM